MVSFYRIRVLVPLFLFAQILFILFPAFPSYAQHPVLFTPEEAAELQLSEAEWAMPVNSTRGFDPGPFIDLKAPPVDDPEDPTVKTISPMNLLIVFRENSAPVDMSSLEIFARKGFLKKNVTARFRQYIRGTMLKVSGLAVPEGKFKIQLTIADIEGNQTSTAYRLQVGE